MKLAITYAVLALIATIINIAVQDIFLHLYVGQYAIAVSILLGTAVGLVTKYLLDKRYIFHFRAHNAAHDGKTFMLYTIMGLLTTAIFWGFEWGFHLAFESKEMRYLGGVIGLAIGYWIKYHLDKKYVFKA